MKYLRSSILILLLSLLALAQDAALERGKALLKGGAYPQAIAHFNSMLEKQADNREAQAFLLRAQIESGDYVGAEKRVKEFLTKSPNAAELRIALGNIEFITGRYAEAAQEFDRAAKVAKGSAVNRALLCRAQALLAQGKDDEAKPVLLQITDKYNDGDGDVSAIDLIVYAKTFALLEKFQDANDLFIDARDADEKDTDALIGQGELLNEKYSYGDAASLFEDALKINSNSPAALTGLAESKRQAFSPDALGAIELALKNNPNYVPALKIKAWMQLEDEKPDDAMKTIDRALAVNPNAVDVRAIRAAIFYAADRKAELDAEMKRVLSINPKAGVFFSTLGHFAVNKRRYADAVAFGLRAVELQPNLWRARTELGIQLLRVGKTVEGRAELEKAFEGDPFNVWAKNTLDLLDSISDYVDTVRGSFIIKTSPKETEAVAPYAADLIEEAHKKLTAKYKFTPKAPIAVELFENHDDFAVKALGLPGLGALGVCFGQTIAMDSPSARTTGEFNWGSTLWHEFMHVISLQMTDYRIPRWFSEGLSVFEERKARPGWGQDWSLNTLKAYTDNRFTKIIDLDAAFTRPKSPDGVPLAYFQAFQVCNFIEEKYGFDTILKMLDLYKQGLKDADVLQRAMQLTPEKFDEAFNSYIQAKTKGYLEALGDGAAKTANLTKEQLLAALQTRPNDYFATLRLGEIYFKEGNKAKAIESWKRATELLPFYTGEGNAYLLLANLYEAEGKKAEATAALDALVQRDETNIEAYKRLAKLKLEAGDKAGAVNLLITSFYITPFDAALHKLAGDAYLEKESMADAIREYRVVVSLKPPDEAGARYDLARALEASGNKPEAKREILRSLEIAPGFEKAQELLLKLRGEGER